MITDNQLVVELEQGELAVATKISAEFVSYIAGCYGSSEAENAIAAVVRGLEADFRKQIVKARDYYAEGRDEGHSEAV